MYLISIFIFLIIPSIFASFAIPKKTKSAALFSLAFIGIPLVIDAWLIVNNVWLVSTIFPFKLIGLIPLEDIVFSFFSIYLIALLYEYILKSHKKERAGNPRSWILASVSFLFIVFFLFFYFFHPEALLLQYAYFWVLCPLSLILLLVGAWKHPRLLSTFLFLGLCCFPFALLYEILALKFGMWSFPGNQYLGIMSLFGVRFPLEEFICFIVLFPMSIAALYEILGARSRTHE